MKRNWLYAVCATAGVCVLLIGILIGSLLPRATTPASPQTPQAEQQDPLAEALGVLREPMARKLFDAAAADKVAELVVFRSANLVTIRGGGAVIASNKESPLELAKAMEAMDRLKGVGLLRGSRRVSDNSNIPTERQYYALTTLGHEAAATLKARQ